MNRILDLIGSGMILSVPKERKYLPALFDNVFKVGKEGHRQRLNLDWNEVDHFLKSDDGKKVCKMEKEDRKDKEGRVIIAGWDSKRLPGNMYDYYRMIQ